MILKVVLFFTCALSAHEMHAHTYNYEIKEFEVPIDHFNTTNEKNFTIRYLYNDTYVDTRSGVLPIFLYTGNEGDIELFAEHTGFLWELAKELKAYVVFAEHRYYGKSLPFGAATFNVTENLVYLTVEQTLEDFGALIQYLTADSNKSMPVIAFGGSYGGMLCAWLRMKYPHLIVGALASSAPILQFEGQSPCNFLNNITTSVFTTALSSNCSENIQNSWQILRNFSDTDEGRNQLNTVFKFCKPLQKPEDIDKVLDYLESVYVNLAVANYPYSTDFLAPLPGYPVREFCRSLQQSYIGWDLVDALQKALNIYSNYTGQTKCISYESAFQPSLGDQTWEIQTCNQIVQPTCSKDTMFRVKEWDFKTFSDNCFKRFKLRPKLNDMPFRYGGNDLQYFSNIIFSNGLLDPWSGGGVFSADTEKITIIIIPDGAHHLDLRASDPDDPSSVKEAREKEKEIIQQWIAYDSGNAIHKK